MVQAVGVGLQAMRDWFAREAGHVRVIGIMSSTCPMCVRGRRDGLEPLLAEPGDLRMAWVFIDMMDTDSRASAQHVSAGATDTRLSAFHDPAQLLGHAMARCLGWTGHVAWDTYFVYAPDAQWLDDELPVPRFWYHQLKDRAEWIQSAEAEVGSAGWTTCLADRSEADPTHFATGDALRLALAGAVTAARSG